jgi:hypothetical protein
MLCRAESATKLAAGLLGWGVIGVRLPIRGAESPVPIAGEIS